MRGKSSVKALREMIEWSGEGGRRKVERIVASVGAMTDWRGGPVQHPERSQKM